MSVAVVDVDWAGRRVAIEYAWVGTERAAAPLLIFLHEGLGSLSRWRDFPADLCQALGWRGLVYSRPGYGRSTPRGADEAWSVDYLHRQAVEVLPALLEALDVDAAQDPPWLLGHSDGGSIALLHAAKSPDQVAGLILLAPHIFVEDLSVQSIAQVRQDYLHTDLRERMMRHHADPDSAFWGWNDIWLHPHFRAWSIEAEIAPIRCPVLAVQGLDDEYGTMAQIDGIVRQVPQTRALALADCGHSPHRDQSEALTAAVITFVRDLSARRP